MRVQDELSVAAPLAATAVVLQTTQTLESDDPSQSTASLLEAWATACCVISADGKLTLQRVSAALCSDLGYRPEQLLGQSLHSLRGPGTHLGTLRSLVSSCPVAADSSSCRAGTLAPQPIHSAHSLPHTFLGADCALLAAPQHAPPRPLCMHAAHGATSGLWPSPRQPRTKRHNQAPSSMAGAVPAASLSLPGTPNPVPRPCRPRASRHAARPRRTARCTSRPGAGACCCTAATGNRSRRACSRCPCGTAAAAAAAAGCACATSPPRAAPVSATSRSAACSEPAPSAPSTSVRCRARRPRLCAAPAAGRAGSLTVQLPPRQVPAAEPPRGLRSGRRAAQQQIEQRACMQAGTRRCRTRWRSRWWTPCASATSGTSTRCATSSQSCRRCVTHTSSTSSTSPSTPTASTSSWSAPKAAT